MPDDDRLPRSLSGHWRRVLKALQAREPQKDIAHHVARATAHTLRRMHGVPDLPALGVQLHRTVTGSAEGGGGDAGSHAPLSHVPTMLARRAVKALSTMMKERLALSSPDNAALVLARRIVTDIAYADGLDRMAPALLASGYSHGELLRQYQSIERSNPLGELARRLLAHPDATGLRAPGRPRPKTSTADLMDVDVGEMP